MMINLLRESINQMPLAKISFIFVFIFIIFFILFIFSCCIIDARISWAFTKDHMIAWAFWFNETDGDILLLFNKHFTPSFVINFISSSLFIGINIHYFYFCRRLEVHFLNTELFFWKFNLWVNIYKKMN